MKRIKLAASLLFSLLTLSAFAGGYADNAKVQMIGVGPFYDAFCGYRCMVVALDVVPTGSPCALNSGWHYAINITTAEGRVIAATFAAAKASGDLVQAVGTNTCVFSNRVEELSYVIAK